MDLPVDHAFCHRLPKAELHAHLSGSVSRETLHAIWQGKQAKQQCLDLEDPSLALKPAGDYPTVLSFFRIFNKYIYRLLDDAESIVDATMSVLEDFRIDGVKYLELRTTPRAIPGQGIDYAGYVHLVRQAIEGWNLSRYFHNAHAYELEAHLILSVDRSMTLEQAMEVVDVAIANQDPLEAGCASRVLGVDLCGNPSVTPISHLAPAFRRAKDAGLNITVHFAETPTSATDAKLEELLSWWPSRLGHAIHVPPHLVEVIKTKDIALELCLSCNVRSKLTEGGFADPHFGMWRDSRCKVALGTDDVGVFESALSNEYLLAAEHFGLSKGEVVGLARKAISAAWAGKERMTKLLDEFS
nr:hypothetical protein B0A51_08645 [Rachicladosporium sp. CCFEE 5018]OQO24192.1 hypothetical protein B0A51_07830 [Rachicladosporium sp. CCFEE 5018]